MLSRTFSDITYPDDVQIGLDALKSMVSGKMDHTSFEKRYVRKDGQLINVIISPAMIRDNEGRPSHFVALFQDITERKRAEEHILKSLKEKDVLLNEVHHRVKNNMNIIISLLRLQSAHIKDEAMKMIFQDCQSRIRAMAHVHEKLYQSKDFTSIDVTEYIKSLAGELFHLYHINVNKIDYKVETGDISLSLESLIPCSMIINELLSNSLKHAFPDASKGIINISLKRINEDEFELIYMDNGIGIPESIDLNSSETMGMQIVESLVEQFRGKVEIYRDGGTEFRIKLHDLKYSKRI